MAGCCFETWHRVLLGMKGVMHLTCSNPESCAKSNTVSDRIQRLWPRRDVMFDDGEDDLEVGRWEVIDGDEAPDDADEQLEPTFWL